MGDSAVTIKSLNSLLLTYLLSTVISLILFSSVLLSIFSPLPVMFSYLRLGRWAGVSIPILIVAILSYNSTGMALSYMLQFALPAVIISEGVRRSYSVGKTFSLAVVTATGLILIALAFHSSNHGEGTTGFVRDFAGNAINESIALNEKTGSTGGQLQEFKAIAPSIAEAVSGVYYSLILVGIGLISWINVIGLSRIFRRLGIAPPFVDLSKWKTPEYLVWGVVVGGVASVSGSEVLMLFGINLLIVLFVVYFFQGMAIISYHFNKRAVPGLVKSVGYFFIVWYLSFLVVIIGLFDLWADFRKLAPPKEHKA